MKLVFLKTVRDDGAFVLLPRAEFTPAELQAMVAPQVMVSLARSASGKCVYALNYLEQHDYHAPLWAADGLAPAISTAPTTTAEAYAKRIEDAIRAAGVEITEVAYVEQKSAPESAYDTDEPNSDWDKYGVN